MLKGFRTWHPPFVFGRWPEEECVNTSTQISHFQTAPGRESEGGKVRVCMCWRTNNERESNVLTRTERSSQLRGFLWSDLGCRFKSRIKPSRTFSSPRRDLLRLSENLFGLELLSVDGDQNDFPGDQI